ncbi:MAG TPA: spore coat U domain-containing protein [Thermodesulfovibrionales bacterium]|nr:spore coat U domain-containing protein [Thermodesulfovibrionales bacterium]
MRRSLVLLSLIVFVLAFAGISSADSRTANLQVTATVIGYCTVATTAVDFGSITGESTALATGDVTVNCPLNTVYNITLDAGQHSSEGFRMISGGGSGVSYNLYKDGSRSAEWGDNGYSGTYAAGTSLADMGTGSDQSHPVYGAIWGGFGGPAAGTVLTDTVLVTVYY